MIQETLIGMSLDRSGYHDLAIRVLRPDVEVKPVHDKKFIL